MPIGQDTTSYTYLLKKEGSGSTAAYKQFLDIKDYPDIYAAPDTIDNTDLSSNSEKTEPGLEKTGSLEFNVKIAYDKFEECKKLEGTECEFAIQFGTGEKDNQFGFHEFKGKPFFSINGKGTGDVRDYKLTIFLSSAITRPTNPTYVSISTTVSGKKAST